jgi:hypothetical protein
MIQSKDGLDGACNRRRRCLEIALWPHRQGETFPTPIRDNVSANPISGFLQHDVKDLMRSM